MAYAGRNIQTLLSLNKQHILLSMDPSFRFRAWSPCSFPHHHHHHHTSLCHHHHHHHHHPHRHHFCPQHGYFDHHHCICNCHFHVWPRFAPTSLQNPEFVGSYPLQKDLNLEANVYKESPASGTQVLHEPEQEGLEEDDEDDPIFVLTDEWREFFAKSEAKRRLEKQQAKRKEKH